MTDVKVAVRLRRKPRRHGFVPARCKIGAHDIADEIPTRFARCVFSDGHVYRPIIITKRADCGGS
jgi:hypothetical protein